MKTIILILLSTLSTFAQLDYSPQSTNKESAVRMHFAIHLLRGGHTKTQENLLLRAIHDRRSINEEEAVKLFTRTQVRDIFFAIGRENIKTYQSMYDLPKIADKKEVWYALTDTERTDIRRINFAWGIGYLDLTQNQIDYLLRFSKALPGITKDTVAVFQAEAEGMFSRDTGTLLFGSIGPTVDKRCGDSRGGLQPQNCPCSVGSSFNMSCDGDCTAAGSLCNVTPDGCGFSWLYRCDGWCVAT